MRSYIFTPKERKVIEGFFAGRVKLGDDIMRQIVARLRGFTDLASDIDLYLELRSRLAEPEEAVST
jgi:hypothetical protein